LGLIRKTAATKNAIARKRIIRNINFTLLWLIILYIIPLSVAIVEFFLIMKYN